MRPFASTLEDFGDPTGNGESAAERRKRAELAAARGEGHAAGYADGFAAGLAQAETEERTAAMALIESVRDQSLQQAGALGVAVAA